MSRFYSDNASGHRKTVGFLFERWDKPWGLRGDPFLWEELYQLLLKEPLPASLTQLVALIEKAFEKLVGIPLSSMTESVYVERYDKGGVSSGHVCLSFWKNDALPDIQRKYLSIPQTSTSIIGDYHISKGPRFIDKPCRYELYPEGCRFGATCRFRHSLSVHADTSSSQYCIQPQHTDMARLQAQNMLRTSLSFPFSQSSSVNDKHIPTTASNSDPTLIPYPAPALSSRIQVHHPHEIPCPHFLIGKCALGEQCRYKHG